MHLRDVVNVFICFRYLAEDEQISQMKATQGSYR